MDLIFCIVLLAFPKEYFLVGKLREGGRERERERERERGGGGGVCNHNVIRMLKN